MTLPGSGTVTSIVTGDLDGDGIEEIIVGTTRGRKLYALRANGTILWGPVALSAEIDSTPAIADLDGDGRNDVVVGVGSTLDPTGTGAVVALKGTTGVVLWSHTLVPELVNLVMSSPAIGDIDGDGKLEVVVGAGDGRVYVFRSDGSSFPGWPRFVRDTIVSSPALADLDNDGKLEIIIGIDTHQEQNPTNDLKLCNPFNMTTPNGGALVVFRADGSLFPGFPVCVDEIIQSSPAVGDIDGDGIPEIVVGTGRFYSITTGQPVGRYVNAWHINGSPVAGWPRPVGGTVFSSPALADLDGDGKLDVVVVSDDLKVYVFRGDGSTIFATQPKSFFGTTPPTSFSPVVADVNGDGQLEVMIPVNTDIAVLSRNGVQLTDDGSHTGEPSLYTETTVTAPVITDLDHDGVLDVVAGSGAPFPSATDGRVYVWNPAKAVGPRPWPKFHRDARNTGWQRPTAQGPVWTEVPGGGLTPSSPAAVLDGTTLHLVVRGTDSRIYLNGRSGGTFGGWSEVPGNGLTLSQPAAGLDSAGALRLYIQGTDNGIWVNTRTGGTWSGWSPVPGGGLTPSGPAAVLDGGAVRLVVRGTDDRIYTATP